MNREFNIQLMDRNFSAISAFELLRMFPTFAKYMVFESDQDEIDFLNMVLDQHTLKEELEFFKYITHLPRCIQVKLVQYNPDLVYLIQNLDEDLQFDVLDDEPELVSKINNPSESAVKFAVRRDANLISTVYEPTEETILVAIRENALAIRHIRDISDVILKEALIQAADTIPFVIHLMDLNWKKFAITQHVEAIKYFVNDKDFSDVLAPLAFDLNPAKAIMTVGEESFGYYNLIAPAIRKDPELARVVSHIDPVLQMELVQEDPRYINFINNPVVEAQKYVVSKHFLFAGMINGEIDPGITGDIIQKFKEINAIDQLISEGVDVAEGEYGRPA